ncbi:alpha/beta fold hydrolase [Neorhizobium alkalisoli]|uniref:Pimeloyl-ACP methyl ester carboxylesterase n=1 Tax=Neorhizobium alkalisoli TaxID=528178 RepID=A0A561QC71_9HYPH|nr:alpha/beta hydrolase [Neorhizobium alkalisoli]TWF47957.1 pimeloyl-ACP methyl ester carboxylesterase [Neorhizobium alkalisoli]
MTATLETAVTEYVDVKGVQLAYRRIGHRFARKLVLLQHFTGTMDAWDPAVVNALAEVAEVFVFDNAGVGSSDGVTPDSVEAMADYAEGFIAALGLGEVDLLGFSLGGFLAQVMAARRRVAIGRMVVAGSAPAGGEEHLLEVAGKAFGQNAPDVRLPLFFTPSAKSQAAGKAFIERTLTRSHDRAPDKGDAVSDPQAKAIIEWCARMDPDHLSLKSIPTTTLIVHGSDDTMFPSDNAYSMFKNMQDATLVLYPDAGHGALFQQPERFVTHVKTFLEL